MQVTLEHQHPFIHSACHPLQRPGQRSKRFAQRLADDVAVTVNLQMHRVRTDFRPLQFNERLAQRVKRFPGHPPRPLGQQQREQKILAVAQDHGPVISSAGTQHNLRRRYYAGRQIYPAHRQVQRLSGDHVPRFHGGSRRRVVHAGHHYARA